MSYDRHGSLTNWGGGSFFSVRNFHMLRALWTSLLSWWSCPATTFTSSCALNKANTTRSLCWCAGWLSGPLMPLTFRNTITMTLTLKSDRLAFFDLAALGFPLKALTFVPLGVVHIRMTHDWWCLSFGSLVSMFFTWFTLLVTLTTWRRWNVYNSLSTKVKWQQIAEVTI